MNPLKMRIHGKFQSLMQLTAKLDQTPKRFGTREPISHAGIHLIEIIGENSGLSVSDIARQLDITKGAVSQHLKRLEKKGFCAKSPDPANRSRSVVRLTHKGKTAFHAHRHWHETMDGGFMQYLEELNPDEFKVILGFLDRLEDFLKRRVDSPE